MHVQIISHLFLQVSGNNYGHNQQNLDGNVNKGFTSGRYEHNLSKIWSYSITECLAKKSNIMRNLLYIVAVILVIGWLIGFIGYSSGGLIHILLVIAVIAILLQLIQGKKIV